MYAHNAVVYHNRIIFTTETNSKHSTLRLVEFIVKVETIIFELHAAKTSTSLTHISVFHPKILYGSCTL